MATAKVKRKPRAKTTTTKRRRYRTATSTTRPRRRARRRSTRRKGMAEGMAENFSLTASDSGLRQVAVGGIVAFGTQKIILDNIPDRKTRIQVLAAGTVAAIAFKQNGAAVAMSALLVKEWMTPEGTAEGVYFDPTLLNDGDEPLVLDAMGNVVMMSDGTYASYSPLY